MFESISRPIRDFALLTWPALVDRADDNEIGLTVTVNGQTFSGTLVSRRAWFDGLADSITGNAEAAEMIRGVAGAVEQYASEGDPEMNFLNFKNCRQVGSDGSVLRGQGGFWRIRIDAVDAWSLGVVTGD